MNEFIDNVTPGALKPSDPLNTRKNHAWIEYVQRLGRLRWTAVFSTIHAEGSGLVGIRVGGRPGSVDGSAGGWLDCLWYAVQ